MKTKLNTPKIFLSILVILIQSCGPLTEVPLTPANPGGTPLVPGAESSSATTLPQLSDIISPDNAQNLVEISSWGKGSGHNPTYSPDGTLLAVSSSSGIYLYNSQTLQEDMYFSASGVLDMAFSPDGKTLSVVTDSHYDMTATQWDLASASELNSWSVTKNYNNGENFVALSPDGNSLAITFDDTTVKLLDVASGQELHSLSAKYSTYLAFSPDGKMLASGNRDGTVTLYDVSSGSQLSTFNSNQEFISLAFSPDGRTLAVGDARSFIVSNVNTTLWDVASGSELFSFNTPIAVPVPSSDIVFTYAFSPDGKTLGIGSADAIKLWDSASGNELLTWNASNVESLAFSPDGKTLVSASSIGDDSVKLWDAATGDLLNTLKGDDVEGIAIWSADSKTVAYASDDNTVRLRNVASGEVRILGGHPDWVWSLSFSPDGKTLASASFFSDLFSAPNNVLKLWDVASGSELHTLNGHTSSVTSLAFSPDGKMLASGSSDNSIKLWDVASGSEVRTLDGNTGLGSGVAFSPDGKILASGSSDNSIKLWDVASGSKLRTLSGHTSHIDRVAFSPDGKQLVSRASDGNKLWDVLSGQELAALNTTWSSFPAFSPDSKMLAVCFEDGTVKVFDPASGQELYSLSGHTETVYGLAFSPDGTILATGSGDAFKLWDVASKQELANLSINGAYSIAFSPDGKLILASSRGGIRVWGVQP